MHASELDSENAVDWHRGARKFASFVVSSALLANLFMCSAVALFGLARGSGNFAEILGVLVIGFFVGLIIALPVALTGFVLGYPIWLVLVPALLNSGFSKAWTVAVASVVVAFVSSLLLLIFYGFGVSMPHGGDMTSYNLFLAPGLIAAVLVSRRIYLRAENE